MVISAKIRMMIIMIVRINDADSYRDHWFDPHDRERHDPRDLVTLCVFIRIPRVHFRCARCHARGF